MVEEELGISQARANHAFVAAYHRASVLRADVADDQKLIRQLARSIQQGEIFLIRLHGENEALLRHVEKLFLELANEHIGALNQARHLFQQSIIVNRSNIVAQLDRGSRELADDLRLALIKRRNHCAVLAQCGGITVRISEHHGRDRSFKTMPLGATACMQAQHGHGHHIVAVQSHHAMRGTHKTHTAPTRQRTATLQLIAHDLGDG